MVRPTMHDVITMGRMPIRSADFNRAFNWAESLARPHLMKASEIILPFVSWVRTSPAPTLFRNSRHPLREASSLTADCTAASDVTAGSVGVGMSAIRRFRRSMRAAGDMFHRVAQVCSVSGFILFRNHSLGRSRDDSCLTFLNTSTIPLLRFAILISKSKFFGSLGIRSLKSFTSRLMSASFAKTSVLFFITHAHVLVNSSFKPVSRSHPTVNTIPDNLQPITRSGIHRPAAR